jgi:hypothetical protein
LQFDGGDVVSIEVESAPIEQECGMEGALAAAPALITMTTGPAVGVAFGAADVGGEGRVPPAGS